MFRKYGESWLVLTWCVCVCVGWNAGKIDRQGGEKRWKFGGKPLKMCETICVFGWMVVGVLTGKKINENFNKKGTEELDESQSAGSSLVENCGDFSYPLTKFQFVLFLGGRFEEGLFWDED